jgi:anti-sigma regulatory factor (Ser/Thr protein kinase)
MDTRGYCQGRLESGGTGDVRSAEGPSSVPHPSRRSPQAAIPPFHHGHDLDRWPLQDTLIVEALADTVPSARAYLRQLLSSWGRTELSQDAGVVVSELVTNSVAASVGRRPSSAPVLVWLGSDGHCLLLSVADASPLPPVRLNLRPDAEGGRGLALVEALTNRWGWYPAGVAGLRKFVWAEWRLPDRSRSHDVSGLTDVELERTGRDIRASLALARPGSTACVPMLAHLSAVESELAERSAGRPG